MATRMARKLLNFSRGKSPSDFGELKKRFPRTYARLFDRPLWKKIRGWQSHFSTKRVL